MTLSQVHKERFGKHHVLLHKVFNLLSTDPFVYVEDIKLAANLWIYCIQQNKFKDVRIAIQMNRNHCLKKQLGVKLDDMGILRCHGRFLNAMMTESAKYPKLLPRHDHFTHLLINEVHVHLIHAGVAHTLAQLREEYWIPQGRAEVRKVLSQCLICRRHEGPSFQLPHMPPWPRERVSHSDPFQFIGLDYLGPINVKEGSELRKTWVCLFCMFNSKSNPFGVGNRFNCIQFLSCLRRFVSRRGKPELIISDNAPQFKLTSTALNKQWRKVFHDEDVLNYVAMNGIRWNFTTALAPWQGGFYERLVGMVKRHLRKVTGRKHFTLEQLATILTEVEAVLNSRPLTYVYEDLGSGFVLTPSHFLVTEN